MAQSQTVSSLDTCKAAAKAALEKGMDSDYCTDDNRMVVLGEFMGIPSDEVPDDPEQMIEDGPGDGTGSVRTRQWVLARADRMIADGSDPKAALNEAWGEVPDAIEADDDDYRDDDDDSDDDDPGLDDDHDDDSDDDDGGGFVSDDDDSDDDSDDDGSGATLNDDEPDDDVDDDGDPDATVLDDDDDYGDDDGSDDDGE